MRIVPAFAGLVRTELARSGGLARLADASRARWSGVLSRHPLTSSVWGLARWSPAALSGRLAGWATVRPWDGGWAERLYSPPRARRRRSSGTARSDDLAAPGLIPPAPLAQGEADGEAFAPTAWRGDLAGGEAGDTAWTVPSDAREWDGGAATADAGAGSVGSPVERLVGASLGRAHQMPVAAWADLRLTQPGATVSAPVDPGGQAAAAPTSGHGAVSRGSGPRVARQAVGAAERRGSRGWTHLVEAEPSALTALSPLTASGPLTAPSLQRLWQPVDTVRPPLDRPSALADAREAVVDGSVTDTVDGTHADPRPADPPTMSGPPSPARLWQPPAPGLVLPGGLSTTEGSAVYLRPRVQRMAEASPAPFVAPPLHPARLWHPPLVPETGATAAARAMGSASGGIVYRPARSRRETASLPMTAFETLSTLDTPMAGPDAVQPGAGLGLVAADHAAPIPETRAPQPGAPPGLMAEGSPTAEDFILSSSLSSSAAARTGMVRAGTTASSRVVQRRAAGQWPLGEPMTTTKRHPLTGVASPSPRPARVALSESDSLRRMPRQLGAVQRVGGAVASSADEASAGSSPAAERAPAAPWSEAASVAPHPDWPVLGQLTSLAAPAAAPEPAAFQALRRLAPARATEALTALAGLPGLGGGEALRDEVRRPMETLTRRDLSGVRVYTSPVAETLGAEAFTTGQRVVFAPGRLNLGTPQGMALLGHELSHVGQRLAFKLTASANAAGDDAEEQAAGQQEDTIRQVVEQGWPEGSRREVRQAARALSAMMQHGGVAAPPLGGPAAAAAPGGAAGGGGANGANGANGADGGGDGTVARARLSESPQAGASAPAAKPDVEALARQVYSLLKARLRAERERHA